MGYNRAPSYEHSHTREPEKCTHVVGVEGERIRGTLGTAPEWLAAARDCVLGQTVEQLTDCVVVLLLELQTSPDDALLEGERLVGDKVRDNLVNLLLLLAGVLEVVLEEVWLREVGVDDLRRLDEEVVELLPGPLRDCQ